MKYVALLRGINVGGNSIIKMADLKKAFEDCGFTNVSTYIASGNVLFESDQSNEAIAEKLEGQLSKTFNLPLRIVVLSYPEFKKAVTDAPDEWKTKDDIRKDMTFIRKPVTAESIAPKIELKEGIDFLKVGKGILYMSTLHSGITKSRFSRIAGKPFYKDITIRSYTTTIKLLAKMGQ
jgi:uncharacterized protein (DUF1697 family)